MDRRLIVLSLVLIGVLHVLSVPQLSHVRNKQTRFCGKKLHETMQALCENNPIRADKRSLNELFYDSFEDEERLNGEDYEQEWLLNNLFFVPSRQLPRNNNNAEGSSEVMVKRLMGGKSGVVDECCYKSCTLQHLATYCGGSGR